MTRMIMLMLLLHHVADYTLQGWLADGKQKSWWDKACGDNLADEDTAQRDAKGNKIDDYLMIYTYPREEAP